ncbi:MAG: hypothetical protein K6F56_08495 [Oscillospiraceae bacterium]|nr:hypothetical protein [Oscillospiraceae bacterium]
MSKYDRLWEYVREHAPAELSFAEVEAICGFPVDHAFLTYKKELPDYGYEVGKISMKNKTVKFVRLK